MNIPPVSAMDPRFEAARRLQTHGREGTFTVSQPGGPPPEVLDALDGAARVHDELRAHGLSVSFDVQPEGDVKVSVVDGSGNVVRDLAPAHALALFGLQDAVEQLVS